MRRGGMMRVSVTHSAPVDMRQFATATRTSSIVRLVLLWFFFSFRGWQNIIRVDGEHYEEIPRYSLKREIILRRTRISRRKMYDYFEYRFLKNISIRPRARFQFFLFPFFFFYS